MQLHLVLGYLLTSLIVFMICLTGAIYMRRSLLRKHEQVQQGWELQDAKHQRQQDMLRIRIEIQEETFRAVSLEIHDNIGQMLSLSKLYLSTIELPQDGRTQEQINGARDLIGQSIGDLRDLCRSLTLDHLATVGLEAAIMEQLDHVRRTGRIVTRFTADEALPRLTADQNLIIFRMVQEVLSNLIKHAKASFVEVRLLQRNEGWTMEIEDNGQGFETSEVQNGHGLRDMKHRAELLGAVLAISSRPGSGTKIHFSLPIH